MLASVFPLVDKDFPRALRSNLNVQEIIKSINTLIKNNLMISSGIFELLKRELESRQDSDCSTQSLYLNFKHSETLFEYLESSLSTLNLCVSASSLQNIGKVEELSEVRDLLHFICDNLLRNLTDVYSYHMNYLVSADLLSFTSSGLPNTRHQQSQILDTQSDAYFLKQGQVSYSSLYLQIVLSSFQIVESITKDN